MVRFLLPVGIFALLVAFLAVGLRLDPREVPSPLIDKPAPAFQLPRLKVEDQTFGNQDLMGKVSLLNVWASWCVACRQEHALLVELSRDDRITIFGLNYKDTRKDALRWLQLFGDPYAAVAVDQDGRVGIDYGVYGVPETYLIDKKGIIRHKHIGPLTVDVVQEKIMPLVERLRNEAG